MKTKRKHETPPIFEVVNNRAVANAVALGLVFNVSKMTITNYVRKGMPYLPERGKFDLALCTEWYAKHAFKDYDTLTALTVEEKRLKNERTKREDRKEQGKLVDVGEVFQTWSVIASTTKNQIQAIPRKFATQLVGLSAPEIEACLSKATYEALQAIDKECSRIAEEEQKETDNEPKAA